MNTDPIHGGLTAQRFFTLPKYPAAEGWQLKGRLVGNEQSTDIPVQYFADAAAGSWSLEWPPEQTAPLATADYTLLIIALDGSGKELLAHQEPVRVFAADGTDLRSQTKRTLDAINATIEKKASSDELSRSFNGRSIGRLSWEELLKAQSTLQRKYKIEQDRAAGKKRISTVNYRFV